MSLIYNRNVLTKYLQGTPPLEGEQATLDDGVGLHAGGFSIGTRLFSYRGKLGVDSNFGVDSKIMNAPYSESLVESLMVKQNMTRSHAVAEAIWTSASAAVNQAFGGALHGAAVKSAIFANRLTENKTPKVWAIRPSA
jgi:hypothetical protein